MVVVRVGARAPLCSGVGPSSVVRGRCCQLCNNVEVIKILNNNCQDKSPNPVLPQQVIDLMDEVVHGMSIVYDAVSTCDAGVSSVQASIDALRAEHRVIRRMLRNILGVIDGDRPNVAPDSGASIALPVPLQAVPPWDTDNG